MFTLDPSMAGNENWRNPDVDPEAWKGLAMAGLTNVPLFAISHTLPALVVMLKPPAPSLVIEADSVPSALLTVKLAASTVPLSSPVVPFPNTITPAASRQMLVSEFHFIQELLISVPFMLNGPLMNCVALAFG